MTIRKAGLMIALGLVCAPGLWAAAVHHPYSPHPGVLCDAYICADSTGISQALTGKYLGQGRADKLAAAGAFDTRAFTFAGGLFCDVEEKLCRDDRYFGPDGKRSGRVNHHYTALLFGAGK